MTVDYELRGCPIDRRQLLDTLAALLVGRKPRLPAATVCTECKRSGSLASRWPRASRVWAVT